MESSRLPRFKRALAVSAMQVTKRDSEILQLIHEHRSLRSSHVCALVGGSRQQVLRRLKLLYHHGYLERPRAQIQYYNQGGSHCIVYGLGKKGAAVLSDLGLTSDRTNWGVQNRYAGRVFLEHALFVSDVMVAIELNCRHRGIRLISQNDLGNEVKAGCRFQWRVTAKENLPLSVTPDRVFALEFEKQNGETERAIFFLEADRGTMPVIRKHLGQTSFYRKLLAYEATWAQSIHQKRFGFHRFRVITVTTCATRCNGLIEACSKLKSGHGLFLFADRSILEKPAETLTALWHTGRKGETASLLD